MFIFSTDRQSTIVQLSRIPRQGHGRTLQYCHHSQNYGFKANFSFQGRVMPIKYVNFMYL